MKTNALDCYYVDMNNSEITLKNTINIIGSSITKQGDIYGYYIANGNINIIEYDITSRTIISLNKGGEIFYKTIDSTASAGNVLSGTTIYTSAGKIHGTMPNNGTLSITPSVSSQSIPAGYTSGGTVAGDANLTQANIRSGVTIFGVTGNLEPDKPDQTKTVTPSATSQVVEPDVGYELSSVTVNPIPSNIYHQTTAPSTFQGIWIESIDYESTTIVEVADDTSLVNNRINIVRGTSCTVDGYRR